MNKVVKILKRAFEKFEGVSLHLPTLANTQNHSIQIYLVLLFVSRENVHSIHVEDKELLTLERSTVTEFCSSEEWFCKRTCWHIILTLIPKSKDPAALHINTQLKCQRVRFVRQVLGSNHDRQLHCYWYCLSGLAVSSMLQQFP